MVTLGLGKTLFNSSVCSFAEPDNAEIFLTERLSRQKASGSWPSQALLQLSAKSESKDPFIFENRDVEDPFEIEKILNSQFPFFEFLKKNRLEKYSRHFNPAIRFITHHLAHAHAAAYMSPFEKCLILVIDGAGSRKKHFEGSHPESPLVKNFSVESAEERSVYTFDRGNLICVDKNLQTFEKSVLHPDHYFSEGLGSCYEKVSEFIFNSKRSAGKVMGLAAYGQPMSFKNNRSFLEELDWSRQFKGKSKKEWESSENFQLYCDVAASMQLRFEEDYIGFIQTLKSRYPDYDRLIVTGGCALNCTSNMKLHTLRIFEEIYVPPFPGDECIGLGAAYAAFLANGGIWQPKPHSEQHGYFGPRSSVCPEQELRDIFSGYEIIKPASITRFTAEKLSEGHVVGWFQGRSESGPRALGNRSILARPDKSGMKDFLNSHIKFRESFRPYGSSVLHEKSDTYFTVEPGFNNPYMSFATSVRDPYKERLKEVTHADGTSRMQTVRQTQNPKFYDLIREFGELTDLYCVLNTSLNVMGEPIVETAKDAENFLSKVPVYGLAAGDLFIRKKA